MVHGFWWGATSGRDGHHLIYRLPVTHNQSLQDHPKMQTLSLVLALATTCLAANLPLDLPEGPPMTLRVRRDTPGYAPPAPSYTLSRATVTPRAGLVPSTLLSKPTPRQTSSGVFVTVREPNTAADSHFSASD